jgi:hypothetical protein
MDLPLVPALEDAVEAAGCRDVDVGSLPTFDAFPVLASASMVPVQEPRPRVESTE